MTLKEMREIEMTKAIKKYATIVEAAKVLDISTRTLLNHKIKFKLKSGEMKDLKPKNMFSIFDMDTNDYLYTGRNSETERECLESYLMYRDNEYWGDEYPKNLSKAIKKEPKENILEDMNFCNFILREHINKN